MKVESESNKPAIILLAIFGIVFIGIIILLVSTNPNSTSGSSDSISSNVTTENNSQLIAIQANSTGYAPATITAKGETASKLVIDSVGAFGCESSLVISKLNIRKNLPANGKTEIDIPAQNKGTSLVGACSMGMYTFKINFI